MVSLPLPRPVLLRDRRSRPEDDPEALVGRSFGHWRVEATAARPGGATAYCAACTTCGNVEVFGVGELLAEVVCLRCLEGAPPGLDEAGARTLARLAAVPRLDPDLPVNQDPDLLAWCSLHPEGSTLEECSRAFGISGERVRQLEERALAKLHKLVASAGYGPEDVA